MTFSGLENIVPCSHHMVHCTEKTFRGSSKLNSYNKYFPEALKIVLFFMVLYKFFNVLLKVSDHNCSGI